ncbi:MAG: ribosomal RNA small subunit methyltransferase A [Caldisericia bacterium]|nr:ribosomal RNA small subunit methyltransferase A [Caldisericia bacterium]
MIRPKKSLGQNFLTNVAILEKIKNALELKENDTLLEIGPGPGSLTNYLLPFTSNYSSIEIDERFTTALGELKSKYPFFNPFYGDFLNVSLESFKECKKVVGNLPYNISTPIMERVALELNPEIVVCMFAEGTADRYTAQVGTDNYSSGSVFIQSFFDVKQVCTVKKGSFYPPPKINSKVLLFKPLTVNKKETLLFTKFVQRLFSFRRKTLYNALKNSTNQSIAKRIKDTYSGSLGRRPEMISKEEFQALYELFKRYEKS